MQYMTIRPKHGISVRNPQAPGPRSRSALCSRRRRYDARRSPIFADCLRSGVLWLQCRRARGGIPLVAISVRACMPGQRTGVLVYVFLFRPHRGVSRDQPIRPPISPRKWVQACPQRTQTAPIYSAQFRPSVRKRTKVARELRDQPLVGTAENGFKVDLEEGSVLHRANTSRLWRQLVALIVALEYG